MQQESNEMRLLSLPRGGYLIKTSAGNIQFGCPPETIKDTMLMPEKVPSIFLLPGELFHVAKGIAVAELEFPIYYNYFILQKKILIIGSDEQYKQLQVILHESVFGPAILNVAQDFSDGKDNPFFPDLKAEMNFFRSDRELDDIVEFGIFNDDVYIHNGVLIRRHDDHGFSIEEAGKEKIELPWSIDYHIKYNIGNPHNKPFAAPEFAVTCLGPSHGFDPSDNTSGFILWLNQRGIMIDPPVNSTEWLHDSHVNPKLIKHVILTHCHADHDAGTFQKILEENTITIHSTKTVMDSFLRKYSAMTKIPVEHLQKLFYFNQILLNQPVYIEGGEFIFHYALHSIPTIGFQMRYGEQSFFYSSDHLNHPDTIQRMHRAKIFPQGRLEFLLNFPWDTDIIYHEAGIPPLHTPIDYLSALPEELQKKITVYHIAAKDFPKENTHLTLAKFGMENTLFFKTKRNPYSRAIRDLDVMANVELFSNFSAAKARDFLTVVKRENIKKGKTIIQKNSAGDKFYMILSGQVAVMTEQNENRKIYEKYEYFGEASLISNELRGANVVAQTDVQLLVLDKHAFLSFIAGSRLEENLRRLTKTRESNSWDILTNSSLFSTMTSHQKTQLEGILQKHHFYKNEKIIEQGEVIKFFYVLIDGEIEVTSNKKRIKKINMGDFIGDLEATEKNSVSSFAATALCDSDVYRIKQKDMSDFISNNPGVYMRLLQKDNKL